MRPTGSPQELQRRRERALRLLREGYQPCEVAERVGVDRRSVRRWKSAVQKRGEKAIQAKPSPGRPWKLAAIQRKRLQRLLLRGAKAAGFSTNLWTCPRVAKVIEMEFGVLYHVDHVGRLLHGLGWTPQKPERRAVERDEVLIAGWVHDLWPKVKKTPRA